MKTLSELADYHEQAARDREASLNWKHASEGITDDTCQLHRTLALVIRRLIERPEGEGERG